LVFCGSGSGFNGVTSITFDQSVTGFHAAWLKNDVNWNAKVSINSDGSMTLRPILTQSSDPAGLTTWTVTVTNAAGATAHQSFTLNYTH